MQMCVLQNISVAGSGIDLSNAPSNTYFCESRALLMFSLASFEQAVQACRCRFYICTGDCRETRVHFIFCKDGLLLENHHKQNTVSGILIQGFFEYDQSEDIPFGFRRVQKFRSATLVILCVFGTDCGEFLDKCARIIQRWCTLQYCGMPQMLSRFH